MTIRTGSQAIAAAKGQTRNVPGTCQRTVRTWFNAPSAGDQDGDGDADAVDGWKSEPLAFRHPGDRNPPPGRPLAFKGGKNGYGHRALSAVDSVFSTDMYGNRYKAGYTSRVTGTSTSDAIAKIERSMGVTYLGWSDTIDGYPIPKEAHMPKELFTTRIASINLMSLPENQRLKATLDSLNTIPLIGIQEATLARFKKALKTRYPSIIGLGELDDETRAAPLVAKRGKFLHIKTGERLMHKGRAGISYTRRLVWAIVEERVSKARIGVINLHAVRVKKDTKYEQRLAMREQDKAALRTQVADLQKLDLPIAVIGDFNDRANWLGTSFGGQRVQRVQHGIDQILFVDSSSKAWKIESWNHKDTPSDHDTVRAKVTLSSRA
jgi:hypothetical protein